MFHLHPFILKSFEIINLIYLLYSSWVEPIHSYSMLATDWQTDKFKSFLCFSVTQLQRWFLSGGWLFWSRSVQQTDSGHWPAWQQNSRESRSQPAERPAHPHQEELLEPSVRNHSVIPAGAGALSPASTTCFVAGVPLYSAENAFACF